MREDVIGPANVADTPAAPSTLLAAPPRVINVGLELFAENLASQGAAVVHVRWSPPAGGNARLASLLTKLRS
jgi:FdrA protein